MKPIVQYISVGSEIRVGTGTTVIPIDHPGNDNDGDIWDRITNGYPVHTSTVLSYDAETGEFETLNTRYRLATA